MNCETITKEEWLALDYSKLSDADLFKLEELTVSTLIYPIPMTFVNECKKRKTNRKTKKFLCIEDGQKFIIEASDMNDAKEKAAIFNAQVITQLKK